MANFQFSTTPKIISSAGSLMQAIDWLEKNKLNKPMIVTDAGIVSLGLLAPLEERMLQNNKSVYIFDQVQADPSVEIVTQAIDFARNNGIDSVLGIGGGSSLDVAKLVAIQTHNSQTLEAIFGVEVIQSSAACSKLPLILAPTTAGTGSEVTAVAIVTTGNTTKAGIVSEMLYPDIAILDAQLTLSLPSSVTAATGIDAMVHAIEAFTSKIKKNPYSDMLAKQALLLLTKNIETATFSPSDISARQAMLLGACLAGQAFANAPVGAIHALAYPLGGHFHIPHGLSNALVMPHVMRFNATAAADMYAELYTCLQQSGVVFEHLERTDNTRKQTTEQQAEAFITFLFSLVTKLGLPTKLRELGITKADIDTLSIDAMKQTRLLVNNPKEVSLEDAMSIYQQAL
ncbi:iron-containing alcohol dehydrogenase [Glaciecola sp. KUL10]|uniref:iron-containing alcohol dehydrogenase n=1 Tax=Glaciecola sp. (strain KUL10) TaxID=2161813 RepID=UPI000D784B74|nr:iron-containing alcohol dehydrogenase [Glaciecola sp. KUL10]